MIKVAKNGYIRPRLSAKLGMKKLWKNARDLGLVASSSSSVGPAFTADEFNRHTVGFGTPDDSLSSSNVIIQPTSTRTSVVEPALQFGFRNVDDLEVFDAIEEVKSGAVGLDKIPLKFIKLVIPVMLPHITHIVNYAITSSCCPSIWKLAKVFPCHKKSKTFNLDDYRSINILATLSKVFEILLKKQIQHFLLINKLLLTTQSAYRRAHSTTTALLKISLDLKKALDKKMVAVLLLLDFSKAFDTVNHEKLCWKLHEQFYFGPTAISLISSYLKERSQAVVIDGVFSEFLPVNKGVPQGSVLGPLLFSLFINDMPSAAKYMVSHLFADDAQMYKMFAAINFHESVRQINVDVKAVNDWANENQLILNHGKTQAIIFGSKCNYYPLVYLQGNSIPFTRKVKNLGLLFNERFTWLDQAEMIAKKVYAGLRSLWPLANKTPQRTRLTLAKSLLLPHFSYGCEIFSHGLDTYSKKPIEKALKSIVRYVYGLPRLESTAPYIGRFLGCSLESFFKFRSLCLLFKIIRSGSPGYLSEAFRMLQSSRASQLDLPQHGTGLEKSLFVKGVIDWNGLPAFLRNEGSYERFKDRCLRFFRGF